MKTILCAGAVVLAVIVGAGGCAKAATTQSVTCGTGTHSDGQGTCQLDNALTLNNIVGSNYWACPDIGNRGTYYFYLSLNTNGTATLWQPGQTTGGANSFQHYSLTWQEGSATDEITVSANPYFDTIKQIVPSAPVGAQSFQASFYLSGVLRYSFNSQFNNCLLTLGTF
jgi:hypothetical protein